MTAAIDLPHILELRPGDDIAEAVANEAPVIGFHLDGSLPPLLCLRAWRKEVDRYRRLAEAFGPDQPIHAVSPPRGETVDDFPNGTDAWARHFREGLGPLLEREPVRPRC